MGFWNWFKGLFSSKAAAPVQPSPVAPANPTVPAAQGTVIGYRLTVLNRWRGCQILPTQKLVMESQAARALSFKTNFYDPVEKAIGIPWYVVAALDMREESFNHSGYLGNGDPWNKKSVHVPAGRGPFNSWYEGAIDALKLQGFDKVGHWDIVTALIHCENYNGLGYKKRGMPSPYVWAKTSVQVPGKYVADGKFDSSAIDSQPGCAALFLALKQNHGVDLNEA